MLLPIAHNKKNTFFTNKYIFLQFFTIKYTFLQKNTVIGGGSCEEIFAGECVVYWPKSHRLQCPYGLFPAPFTHPLKSWCAVRAKSFEVVLCSIFVVALARVYFSLGEKTHVPVTFIAPLRDGEGEADAIGLFAD